MTSRIRADLAAIGSREFYALFALWPGPIDKIEEAVRFGEIRYSPEADCWYSEAGGRERQMPVEKTIEESLAWIRSGYGDEGVNSVDAAIARLIGGAV